jgi:hypothetical protein
MRAREALRVALGREGGVRVVLRVSEEVGTGGGGCLCKGMRIMTAPFCLPKRCGFAMLFSGGEYE